MLCDACGRTDIKKTQPSRDERWPGRWCTRCVTRYSRHGDVTVILLTASWEGVGCSVCGDPVKVKGLCNRHYLRSLRHGSPEGGNRERRPFEFWVRETEHGLVWGGQLHVVRGTAYGRFGHTTAHRVAYEKWVGPIPEGDYVVDHQPECPKICITPAHLTLYTHGEHTRVGWQRGEITGEKLWKGRRS